MSAGEEPPVCDREGCDRTSAYLLMSGDLCEDHAADAEPEVVEYLRATLGRPPAAEDEDDPFVTDGGFITQAPPNPKTSHPDRLLGRRVRVDWGDAEDVGEIAEVRDHVERGRELSIRIPTERGRRMGTVRVEQHDCELLPKGRDDNA